MRWCGSFAQELMSKIRNFPLRNHDRARGLQQRAQRQRARLASTHAALRDELRALPQDGDPAQLAMNLARAHHLQEQLLSGRYRSPGRVKGLVKVREGLRVASLL